MVCSLLYSLVRVLLDVLATSHGDEAKLRAEDRAGVVGASRRKALRGRSLLGPRPSPDRRHPGHQRRICCARADRARGPSQLPSEVVGEDRRQHRHQLGDWRRRAFVLLAGGATSGAGTHGG